MKGHQPIIEMRMARKAPRIVFVNDYPCATDWFDNEGDAVTISTAGDDLSLVDLRFLVGLTVTISSPNEQRAKHLFDLCKQYAKTVAACHIQEDLPGWKQTGWTGVWRKGESNAANI